MKQQTTKMKKEKGLINFIEDKQRIITVIGVFTAIITYLFKFLLESNNLLIKENLGWGIMLAYGLLLIMSFLLFLEASKKNYSALSVLFCVVLLGIVLSFYSYISSSFQKPITDFTQIILFYLPIFLVIFVISKIKKIKLFWSIFCFILLICLFISRTLPFLERFYSEIVLTNNILSGLFIGLFLFLLLISFEFISWIINKIKKFKK